MRQHHGEAGPVCESVVVLCCVAGVQVLEPGTQGASGLIEGDLILEVNQQPVAGAGHGRVVEMLKECPVGAEATLVIQRGTGQRATSCFFVFYVYVCFISPCQSAFLQICSFHSVFCRPSQAKTYRINVKNSFCTILYQQ